MVAGNRTDVAEKDGTPSKGSLLHGGPASALAVVACGRGGVVCVLAKNSPPTLVPLMRESFLSASGRSGMCGQTYSFRITNYRAANCEKILSNMHSIEGPPKWEYGPIV